MIKRGRGRPPLGDDVVRYELKLTAEQLQLWGVAAGVRGLKLAEWIRGCCDRAAKR